MTCDVMYDDSSVNYVPAGHPLQHVGSTAIDKVRNSRRLHRARYFIPQLPGAFPAALRHEMGIESMRYVNTIHEPIWSGSLQLSDKIMISV